MHRNRIGTREATMVIALFAFPVGAAQQDDGLPAGPAAEMQTSTTSAQAFPAEDLLERVVDRYRTLAQYEDTVTLEQTTARNGELPNTEKTEVSCELNTDGTVEITTPTEKNRSALGLGFIFDSNPALAEFRRQYDMWLAPHMTLRVHESPLEAFRAGIEEGFMVKAAERVMVEDEEMFRLDLHSGDGDSETYRAKYELFIHPQTLLIMRIRGAQILPDGANLLSDYIITPHHVVTTEGEDVLEVMTVSAAT